MSPADKWLPGAIVADPLTSSDIKTVLRCKYKREPDGVDIWKLPSQTVLDRSGDCEDLAILALKLWLNAGVERAFLQMILGQAWTRRGRIWHAVAQNLEAGVYYDCRYRLQADKVRKDLHGFDPVLLFRLSKPGVALM